MQRHDITLVATMMAAFFLLLTVGAPRASAESVSFDFTSCHVTGGCGTGPYGNVLLTQKGTSVDVVVTLFNGNEFVKTGSGDDYAFKFVGLPSSSATYTGTITNADITITSPSTPSLKVAGPGNYDGDGTKYFAFGIKCPSCAGGSAGAFGGPIDFTVANATISQVAVANSLPTDFVADVLIKSNGKTGPVDAGQGVVVPDGGMTLMLLGTALAGLETLRRRFRA